jgi:hypothetical protein
MPERTQAIMTLAFRTITTVTANLITDPINVPKRGFRH